jgi:hypothetical protein
VAAKKIFPVSMDEQQIAEFKQLAKSYGVPLGALIRDLLVQELESAKYMNDIGACNCLAKE